MAPEVKVKEMLGELMLRVCLLESENERLKKIIEELSKPGTKNAVD